MSQNFQVKSLLILTLSFGALFSSACEKPVELLWKYQSHSASQSTPAIGKHLIVFGTKSGEVHAVNKKGAFKWKMQTRKEVISAPVITDQYILFGSTNMNFYALSHSGRKIWQYTSSDRIKGDPIKVDEDIIFGSYDQHLYRLNIRTGKLIWAYPPLEDDKIENHGFLSDIFATKKQKQAEQISAANKKQTNDKEQPKNSHSKIIKLSEEQLKLQQLKKAEQLRAELQLKKEKANYPHDAFSYAKPILSSDGLIIVGNLDGYIYAIHKDTGKLAWKFKTQGADAHKGVTSSIVEKNGVLYFGANDHQLYALQLKDQKVLWTFKAKDEINSSPIIDEDGQIFFGSRDRNFYSLDLKTGKEKWSFLCEGPVLSWPVVYKKLVIFGAGDGDGHVYALNKNNGKLFWKYKTKGAVDADPVFDGNTFYIASADRSLYAFKVNQQPK